MVITVMGVRYADRRHWSAEYGIGQSTIRKHCRPVAYDWDTGVALYSERDIAATVEQVRSRPGRSSRSVSPQG